MSIKQSIVISIGTTPRPIVVTVTDSAGDPFDLAGSTVAAKIKDTDGTVILDLAPAITDEAGGIITITITDEQTVGLAPAVNLAWDLILTIPDASPNDMPLPPIVSGTVTILKTVTLS